MIKQINIKCHIVYAEVKKRNEENKENKKNENQQQQQKHLNYRPSEWLNTSDKCYILILIICVYLRCVYAYTADNRRHRRTRVEIVKANDILLSGIFASRWWWVTWTRVRAHLLACIIIWLCTDCFTTEIFLLTRLNSLSSIFFYFPSILSKQMNVKREKMGPCGNWTVLRKQSFLAQFIE